MGSGRRRSRAVGGGLVGEEMQRWKIINRSLTKSIGVRPDCLLLSVIGRSDLEIITFPLFPDADSYVLYEMSAMLIGNQNLSCHIVAN